MRTHTPSVKDIVDSNRFVASHIAVGKFVVLERGRLRMKLIRCAPGAYSFAVKVLS